ncbi:MAG: hypothetical protein MMC23_001027 [Stictis urceolatum]|nr:hypothetical protein [Stictis urceolata]
MPTAADYSKRKNADLEDLLRSRSLPHTGKKAELVARLVESDASADLSASAPDAPTATAEDEIDWDEPAATSAPAAAALAAGGTGQVPNPEAVPNQLKGENTSATEGKGSVVIQPGEGDSGASTLGVQTSPVTGEAKTEAELATDADADANANANAQAEKDAAAEKEKFDFSANLEKSSLEAELAKRKARAARFGIQDADAGEATRTLERAKRFGTAAGGESAGGPAGSEVKGLDMALPERERKRGRGAVEQGGREGKRRDSRRREGRGAGGGQRDKDRTASEARAKRFGAGGGGRGGKGNKELSEKDRAAAEARKKRFAAA